MVLKHNHKDLPSLKYDLTEKATFPFKDVRKHCDGVTGGLLYYQKEEREKQVQSLKWAEPHHVIP